MSNYLNKNSRVSCDQNILLGTTFKIMADAINREPACLLDLEESKAKSVLALSGSNGESTEKVRKVEEGSPSCAAWLFCATRRTKSTSSERVFFYGQSQV